MIIRTEAGKKLDLDTLPAQFEGVYCAACGCRLGWYDTSMTDKPLAYCDDCAADLSESNDY